MTNTDPPPPSPPQPLGVLLTEALDGRFPEPHGGWSRVPPWRDGLEAVVAFTGHAVFAVAEDVSEAELAALGVDGFGGAHHPRAVATLAGPDGWIDSLDAVLMARGTGPRGAGLVEREDLADHPRVAFARRLRDDLRVFGLPDRDTLVVLARGIGGLVEFSFEVAADARGSGEGRKAIAAALGRVPQGKPVVAACAPGNAASLRCLLAAGFVPVGSIQLFQRSPQSVASDT